MSFVQLVWHTIDKTDWQEDWELQINIRDKWNWWTRAKLDWRWNFQHNWEIKSWTTEDTHKITDNYTYTDDYTVHKLYWNNVRVSIVWENTTAINMIDRNWDDNNKWIHIEDNNWQFIIRQLNDDWSTKNTLLSFDTNWIMTSFPVLCVQSTKSSISSDNIYPFDKILVDNYNAFDTSTYEYTIPQTWIYEVSWGWFIGKNVDDVYRYYFQVNWNQVGPQVRQDTKADYASNARQTIYVNLNAWDKCRIYFKSDWWNADYWTLNYNAFTIKRIA